jgi:hypothetical protein
MRTLLGAMLCAIALPLHAAFEFDYPAHTMRDTATGLVWTDLAPRGALDARTSLVGGRWRVATQGEVEALFASLGAVRPGAHDAKVAAVFAFLATGKAPPQPPAAIEVRGIAGTIAAPPAATCLGWVARAYAPAAEGWRITEPRLPPAECLAFDPAQPTFLVAGPRR